MSGDTPSEKELKLVIEDLATYRRVLGLLGPFQSGLEQKNFYLDTPDHIVASSKRSILRLREVVTYQFHETNDVEAVLRAFEQGQAEGSKSWEMTFKWGQKTEGGYFESLEWNALLEPEQLQLIGFDGSTETPLQLRRLAVEPVQQFASRLGQQRLDTLRVAGTMRNLRLTYPLDGYLLEVDQTVFMTGSGSARIDYEIEVETSNPQGARQLISQHLEAQGVRLSDQTQTKFQRFLQSLAL